MIRETSILLLLLLSLAGTLGAILKAQMHITKTMHVQRPIFQLAREKRRFCQKNTKYGPRKIGLRSARWVWASIGPLLGMEQSLDLVTGGGGILRAAEHGTVEVLLRGVQRTQTLVSRTRVLCCLPPTARPPGFSRPATELAAAAASRPQHGTPPSAGSFFLWRRRRRRVA